MAVQPHTFTSKGDERVVLFTRSKHDELIQQFEWRFGPETFIDYYFDGTYVSDWQAISSRVALFAPINRRYRQLVHDRLSWREILEALDFNIHRRHDPQDGRRSARVQQSPGQEAFYLLCIFHEERTPSLCLGAGGFTCFGCVQTGGKVDFVAHVRGLRKVSDIKEYFADTFPQMQPRNE